MRFFHHTRRLIAELVNLEDALVKPKDIPKVGEQQLSEWIESIRAALMGDDIDLARQAIRQFVAKIVVNEKAGTLYYTFPLSHLSRLRNLTLTGFGTACVPSLNSAILRMLYRLYFGIPLPLQPISEKHLSKSGRYAEICDRYSGGETLETLARDFNLSPQRIHEILLRWCA